MLAFLCFCFLQQFLFGQDTLNQFDANGKKHGLWIITQKSANTHLKTDTLEKGNYVNGKKEGVWYTYHSESIFKTVTTYKNNLARGTFITYDEFGCLLSFGNRDEKSFKDSVVEKLKCDGDIALQFYQNNEVLKKYVYTNSGKIKSYTYYYPKSIDFRKINSNAKNNEHWIRYDTSGKITWEPLTTPDSIAPPEARKTIKPELYFDDWYLSKQLTPYSYTQEHYRTPYYKNAAKKFKTESNKHLFSESDSIAKIEEDGQYKNGRLWDGKKYLYNQNGLIHEILKYEKGIPLIWDGIEFIVKKPANVKKNATKIKRTGISGGQLLEDGEFRDGKLWNGKKYVYDKDGLLMKIEIYKEGKYAGNAQID